MSSPIDRIASIIFPDHHRHTALKSAPDSVLGSTSRPPDKMAPRVASSGANAAASAHHRALPAQPMTSLHTVDAGKVARAWPSTQNQLPRRRRRPTALQQYFLVATSLAHSFRDWFWFWEDCQSRSNFNASPI